MGSKPAMEFLGGYIIEMSLSLDNLFLFLMVFSSFNISLEYQERVWNNWRYDIKAYFHITGYRNYK